MRAGVAQSVEQLPCKHQVEGSSPPASSKLINNLIEMLKFLPLSWIYFCDDGCL